MTTESKGRIRRKAPMLFGPILVVELIRIARRRRYFVMRCIYGIALLLALFAVALAVNQDLARSQGRMLDAAAQFGRWFFFAFAHIQLAFGVVLAISSASGAVAEERQRRTIEFLFATDLTNREFVLGKIASRVITVFMFLAAAAPVLALSQLYGAVPLDWLLQAVLVTCSTVISVSSIAVLISVWSPRPRDAVVRAFVVVTMLASAPVLFVPMRLYVPNLYYYVDSLAQYLLDANPILFLATLQEPRLSFWLLSPTGWLGTKALLWSQMVITFLCVAVAMLRVRSAHLASVSRAAVATKRKPGFLSRFFGGFVLRDVLPPMVWREVFSHQTVRGLSRSGIVAAVLIDLAFLIAITVLWFQCRPNKPEFGWDHFTEVASLLSIATGVIYIVIAAVRAAGSVTSERESQCWETLLSTTLSGPAIVTGKLFGAVLSLRLLLAHVLIYWLFVTLLIPEYWWRGLAIVGVIAIVALPICAAGIYFSIRAATGGSAIFSTIMVLMVSCGIHVLIIDVALGIVRRHPPDWLSATSSVWLLFWISLYETTAQRNWMSVRIPTYVAIQGIIGYLLTGIVLWIWIGLQFDRWTNRIPTRNRRKVVFPESTRDIPASHVREAVAANS